MSGEEVVHILNDEIEDLIEALAGDMDGSYDEIKRIIAEDEEPEEMRDAMKEMILMMFEGGRISREQADEIIRRLEE